MDELQKELLAILRELKEGASPAFQEIVAQRSDYCMVVAITASIAFIGAATLLAWVIRVAPRVGWDEPNGKNVPVLLMGISASVVSVNSFCVAAENWAEAAAPLGRVLEMLR